MNLKTLFVLIGAGVGLQVAAVVVLLRFIRAQIRLNELTHQRLRYLEKVTVQHSEVLLLLEQLPGWPKSPARVRPETIQ